MFAYRYSILSGSRVGEICFSTKWTAIIFNVTCASFYGLSQTITTSFIIVDYEVSQDITENFCRFW